MAMRRYGMVAIGIAAIALLAAPAHASIGALDPDDTSGKVDISRVFVRVARDDEGVRLARFVVETYEPWSVWRGEARFDVRVDTRGDLRPDVRIVTFYDGGSIGWYCDVYQLRRHVGPTACDVTRARPGGTDIGATDRIGIRVERSLLEGPRLRWWVLASSKRWMGSPWRTDRAPDRGWLG
ncbi:MAG TPA: hypothetical protein VF235_02370 [Actinomycetota bacterium]